MCVVLLLLLLLLLGVCGLFFRGVPYIKLQSFVYDEVTKLIIRIMIAIVNFMVKGQAFSYGLIDSSLLHSTVTMWLKSLLIFGTC